MKSKRNLPAGLAEKQELQRQQTINKVLRAVDDIKREGKKVTISALVEYGYASGDGVAVVHKRKKIKQNEIIEEKDRQIAELRAKRAELEQECEVLRGRLFLVMEKEVTYNVRINPK